MIIYSYLRGEVQFLTGGESPRGENIRLIRCNSETDGIVRMKEDGEITQILSPVLFLNGAFIVFGFI